MPLAPEIAALLERMRGQPQMHQTPIAQLRQTRPRLGAQGVHPVGRVEEGSLPGPGGPLGYRLYSPTQDSAQLGLVILLHGGGFVFGSVDGYYDHISRVLCEDAGCRVLSLDYRLAPENKFPAASDDALAGLRWAVAQAQTLLRIDPKRIIIAGGSAGANLAAATALRNRDEQGPALRGQLLWYPMVDYHSPASSSSLAFAEGYYLTRADTVWFWQQYLSDASQADNPYAVPLKASKLNGLPPALVMAAEYDPLRDGALAYAQAMAAEGVEVEQTCFAGMVHGFMAFPTPVANQALQQSVRWVRERLKG
jgi:acetyl esterase